MLSVPSNDDHKTKELETHTSTSDAALSPVETDNPHLVHPTPQVAQHYHTTDIEAPPFPPLSRAVTAGGHPLETSHPGFQVYHRALGDAHPLGLCMFALTTWVLSMMNVGACNVQDAAQVIAPLAICSGGIAQLLGGMWAFASGSTFAGTAFTVYGSFWIGYGVLFLPSAGIASGVSEHDIKGFVALLLFAWMIMSIILGFATMRASVSLMLVFVFVTPTFALLAAANLAHGVRAQHLETAGGALGIITSVFAWYTGASGLYQPATAPFILPVGDLTRKD